MKRMMVKVERPDRIRIGMDITCGGFPVGKVVGVNESGLITIEVEDDYHFTVCRTGEQEL